MFVYSHASKSPIAKIIHFEYLDFEIKLYFRTLFPYFQWIISFFYLYYHLAHFMIFKKCSKSLKSEQWSKRYGQFSKSLFEKRLVSWRDPISRSRETLHVKDSDKDSHRLHVVLFTFSHQKLQGDCLHFFANAVRKMLWPTTCGLCRTSPWSRQGKVIV